MGERSGMNRRMLKQASLVREKDAKMDCGWLAKQAALYGPPTVIAQPATPPSPATQSVFRVQSA